MANPDKHKKNPILEWLGEEDTELGAQGRSPRVVGGAGKLQKAVLKKPPLPPPAAPAKPDPALMREPGPAPKFDERRSQPSSPEHLRKLQRLPRLRAPITYPVSNPRPR